LVGLVEWTDVVTSVSLAIGLAACAGLRAWLPLLLVGGLARGGVITLGSSFGFLGSNRALLLFGAATLIEIVGDKIPAIDHGLDMISTVLRPAAGSLIAASVMWQVHDPLTALALGVAVGAPSALVPHAAKTVLRAASTTLTGGLANPVISLLEDVLALAVFVFTVVVPLLAAIALLAVGFLVVRRMARRSAPQLRTT
jgi:uncharacterized protein DUF4126